MPETPVTHLDEVTDGIRHLEGQGFTQPWVPILDREADSTRPLREEQAIGCLGLVRVNDNPRLSFQGQQMPGKSVTAELTFSRVRRVVHRGKACWQWVAEADVSLTRPAKPSQKRGRKPRLPGEPVPARLVVSRLVSDTGQVLAQGLLLTNVATADAGTIKGVGHIYQQTFIDTYSRVALAKLYTEKTAVTAADMLNDKVIPFFHEQSIAYAT